MSARILCAVDFSEFSREAMRAAADLARQNAATLELVHVEDQPLWTNEPFVHLPGDVRSEVLGAARRELELWRTEAEQRAGARVEARTASGSPWDAIVAIAVADPTIDTIVMGTHGRSGISRALIGSVAERVVRHAPCSVLVVRPPRRR
jgi:nucleotide-binding universal stress UspA family protein